MDKIYLLAFYTKESFIVYGAYSSLEKAQEVVDGKLNALKLFNHTCEVSEWKDFPKENLMVKTFSSLSDSQNVAYEIRALEVK